MNRAERVSEIDFPIGEVRVNIPSLIRGDYDEAGNIRPEREDELMGVLATDRARWFRRISRAIKSGEKSGWYYPVIGGIVVLVGAAGIEFGLREGKDIQELISKFEDYRTKQRQQAKRNKIL